MTALWSASASCGLIVLPTGAITPDTIVVVTAVSALSVSFSHPLSLFNSTLFLVPALSGAVEGQQVRRLRQPRPRNQAAWREPPIFRRVVAFMFVDSIQLRCLSVCVCRVYGNQV